jgi:hypothetical protein
MREINMKRIQRKIGAVSGVFVALGFGPPVALSSAAVSTDDQTMFDQQRYQPLLAQLNQELASKKTAAADRFDLLQLKGEALLRTKATAGAADAFTAAAAVGPDDNSIAIAKVTASLIKHSIGTKYQPKAKAQGSKGLAPAIDIVDATSRKAAFVAFFADLLATLQPQVDRAQSATSLSPIMTLAKQVGDARNVEVAATGSDAQSKDLLTKLATHAGDLMKAVLKPMDDQIAAVTKDAARQQKQLGRRMKADSFSSLSPDDADELDTIVSSAGQVASAAAQMTPIFGDIGDFKTIQTDAEKVAADAEKILKQYHHPAA